MSILLDSESEERCRTKTLTPDLEHWARRGRSQRVRESGSSGQDRRVVGWAGWMCVLDVLDLLRRWTIRTAQDGQDGKLEFEFCCRLPE